MSDKSAPPEIARMTAEAEARGRQWAIDLLRDSQKRARYAVDRQAMKLAADYLEAMAS